MAPSPSVPCPDCGAPLEVALNVQVEVRLTKRGGGYGLGAVRQRPAEVRARLLREHCKDGRLYLGEPEDESRAEGEVVFCSRRPTCRFIGTVSEEGIDETRVGGS